MASAAARPAILITGGAQRVGRVLALYFAARGWDVALHYNTSHEAARAVQAEIRAQGAACELFAEDLTEPDAPVRLMASAFAAFPALRALINSAARFDRAPFPDASDMAGFDSHMAVNFRAPVLLAREFAVRLAGEGAILNLLDVKVHDEAHPYFYYLLSKKALLDFTRMSAKALGPRIRVHGLLLPKVLPNKDETPENPGSPTLATPEDVASAAYGVVMGGKVHPEVLVRVGG